MKKEKGEKKNTPNYTVVVVVVVVVCIYTHLEKAGTTDVPLVRKTDGLTSWLFSSFFSDICRAGEFGMKVRCSE